MSRHAPTFTTDQEHGLDAMPGPAPVHDAPDTAAPLQPAAGGRALAAVSGGGSGGALRRALGTLQRSHGNRALQGLVQRRENRTGLPDRLKDGVEALSGLSLDHVRVHYDSSEPARMHADAYAEGSNIHVAPGREAALPHEAWHVVQQMQGRVRPLYQLGGMDVNDDPALEAEATAMGERAAASGGRPSGAAAGEVRHADVEQHSPVAQPYICIEEEKGIDGKPIEFRDWRTFSRPLMIKLKQSGYDDTSKKALTSFKGMMDSNKYHYQTWSQILNEAFEKGWLSRNLRGSSMGPLSLGVRPSWNSKTKSMMVTGTDLRHVISSSTMGRAIELTKAKDDVIAGWLSKYDVEVEGMSRQALLRSAWETVHNHPGNLWPGGSEENRSKGLVRGPLKKLERKILKEYEDFRGGNMVLNNHFCYELDEGVEEGYVSYKYVKDELPKNWHISAITWGKIINTFDSYIYGYTEDNEKWISMSDFVNAIEDSIAACDYDNPPFYSKKDSDTSKSGSTSSKVNEDALSYGGILKESMAVYRELNKIVNSKSQDFPDNLFEAGGVLDRFMKTDWRTRPKDRGEDAKEERMIPENEQDKPDIGIGEHIEIEIGDRDDEMHDYQFIDKSERHDMHEDEPYIEILPNKDEILEWHHSDIESLLEAQHIMDEYNYNVGIARKAAASRADYDFEKIMDVLDGNDMEVIISDEEI